MTPNEDKQADLKLTGALNEVFASRERDVDGPRMARDIMRAVYSGQSADRPHRRILLKLVKYAAPLAAAATLLLIIYFAQSPTAVQAEMEPEQVVTMAEEVFERTDVQLFDIDTVMTVNSREVKRFSRLYVASGGRFCYQLDGPFGTSWLGSDGTRYWFKPSNMGVMIFDDEQTLRSSIRDIPFLGGALHQFLRLNRLIGHVRENSDKPQFVERAESGPWRVRMKPRRPGGGQDGNAVRKVDIVVDPETKQIKQVVIESVFNEEAPIESNHTMTLTRVANPSVSQEVFQAESHVDPETGTIDAKDFVEKIRKQREAQREAWKNYNPPQRRPFPRWQDRRRPGDRPDGPSRRYPPHDRQAPSPPKRQAP